MSFKSDMGMVKMLENRMTRLGKQYHRLEDLFNRYESNSTLARLIEIEEAQEKVNAQLHRILKKYRVIYPRRGNYYLVEDPDGGEYARFDAEDAA